MTNETKILGESTGTGKYNPDLAREVARQAEIEEKQAKLEAKRKPRETEKPFEASSFPINHSAPIADGFIYVPSINLHLAKKKMFEGADWYDCHERLQKTEQRMPTIPEFIEFLKYLKANPNGAKDVSLKERNCILDEILAIRDPFRGEWFDAKFKKQSGGTNISYNHNFKLTFLGTRLVPKNSEYLAEEVMTDQKINLESWLNNPTQFGLVRPNLPSGTMMYTAPKDDEHIVAAFIACSIENGLNCDLSEYDNNRYLGVRPVLKINPTK